MRLRRLCPRASQFRLTLRQLRHDLDGRVSRLLVDLKRPAMVGLKGISTLPHLSLAQTRLQLRLVSDPRLYGP